MNVFVTGGTGYIGSAVLDALFRHGHRSVALVRKAADYHSLKTWTCRPVMGGLDEYRKWLPALGTVDAVIHTAATFDSDMRALEARFLDALLGWMAVRADELRKPLPFIYTGGNWLYGENGDHTAVEGSPLYPPQDFAYMIEHRERLLDATDVSARILHPAMVWDEHGGVFARFIAAAEAGYAPRVTADFDTRWPLIHRRDLAELYIRVLERGTHGSDYHGVAQKGVPVGNVAAVIAGRYGAPPPRLLSIPDTVHELGLWGACLAWDQTMDAPLTRRVLDWQANRDNVLAAFAS